MSSKSFKARRATEKALALRHRLRALRFHAHGGAVAKHRALEQITLESRDLSLAVLLALTLPLVWLAVQGQVLIAWTWALEHCRVALGLPGAVAVANYSFGGLPVFQVPYLELPAGVPSATVWWSAVAGTVLVILASFALPASYTPLIYFARVAAMIHASALFYFAVRPGTFPYNLADYSAGMMEVGDILIAIVPVLFGLIYYIFDFSLARKIGLTVMTMLHLAIFVPLQYALQGYVIHHFSLLYMPLLFFVFGFVLDIMVVIAFYAWGMSWKSRTPVRAEAPPS